MTTTTFMVGADPEVFVQRNDKFVSAHGLVKGTKQDPFKVNKGAVQVDGMALEFNIDPASSVEEFKTNINVVMSQLASMVPEYKMVVTPVADFDIEVIANCPPEALELGCDPDYNAYTGMPNPRPDGDRPFRTGAGHIHIGWTQGQDINNPEHLEACIMMTKQLDVLLGIPSILVDTENRRRELYGRAGCFRPKPYGVEYRVLSNFWISNPSYQEHVYKMAKRAFDMLVKGERLYENFVRWEHSNPDYNLEKIINEGNVKLADKVCDNWRCKFPSKAKVAFAEAGFVSSYGTNPYALGA